MKLVKGDMFADYPKMGVCYFATTNAVVKKNGELVMGKGNALELAKREPWLPKRMGDSLKGLVAPWTYHGRIFKQTDYWVGCFQTKHHWKDKSDIELINSGVEKLRKIGAAYPDITFYLPFPGIGNGGLKREDVLPLLQGLPDNVIVWER